MCAFAAVQAQVPHTFAQDVAHAPLAVLHGQAQEHGQQLHAVPRSAGPSAPAPELVRYASHFHRKTDNVEAYSQAWSSGTLVQGACMHAACFG